MGGRPRKWEKDFNQSQKKHIWKRDGSLCIYCGAPAQDIDHVIPVSKGGKAIIANGVCSCRRCNMEKHGNLNQDFITRGIFWLLQQGEDMDWVDAL